MYLIIDLFVLDFQPNDSLSHLHKHVFGPHIESTSEKNNLRTGLTMTMTCQLDVSFD